MAACDPMLATLFHTPVPAALHIWISGYLLPVRRNAPTFKLSTKPLSGNLASGMILHNIISCTCAFYIMEHRINALYNGKQSNFTDRLFLNIM